MKLHPNQLGILLFVNKYALENGFPPIYDEMAQELSISKTTVLHHVRRLRKFCLVTQKDNSPRSIKITEAGFQTVALSFLEPEQRKLFLERKCPSCGGPVTEKHGRFYCPNCEGPIYGAFWWMDALNRAKHGNY